MASETHIPLVDATAGAERAAQEPANGLASGSLRGEVKKTKKRLNELDWIRMYMIMCVLYAHVFRSGLPGGADGDVTVDDRNWTGEGAHPFAVRWISENRQYCLPLLFYVSGAACACSFKQRPTGFDKLTLITIFGLVTNGVLWLVGPQNPDCDPGTGYKRSECQGSLFAFTVCPWAGPVFPTVFQMWYTAVLMFYMLLNWPLCALLHSGKACGPAGLVLQWAITTCFAIGLVVLGGDSIPHPSLVSALLSLWEACFLVLSFISLRSRRPSWLPLRLVHYALGVVMCLQFGCTPIVDKIDSISASFALFIFVGFNKSFQLGYVLTLARCDGQEEAAPIVSSVWPTIIAFRTFTAPSTNWSMAGNLTYPYFPRMLDRANYVAGCVVLLFALDRVASWIPCGPLPSTLSYAALAAYLFHPWFMAIWITMADSAGSSFLRDATNVWFGIMIMSVAVVFAISGISQAISQSRRHYESSEASDDSDIGEA